MSKNNTKKGDSDREEKAMLAKNNLVSHYLTLGSAMKRCSAAVEAFAHAINDAATGAEILELLKTPTDQPLPSGLPEQFPFLTTAAAKPGKANGAKKRANEEDSDEPADGKKKKRKNKKAEKDPDAPKRPPSAYLMFQNEVRKEVREKNPGMPYTEVLKQMGDAWKALDEAGKKPYNDAAAKAMESWKEQSSVYVKQPAAAHDEDDEEVENAVVKKDDKPKKEKAPKEKKEKKAKEPAAAANKSVAATSTPAAKNAPKPAPPTSTKKNAPAPVAESSSEEDSDDDSDEDDDSD